MPPQETSAAPVSMDAKVISAMLAIFEQSKSNLHKSKGTRTHVGQRSAHSVSSVSRSSVKTLLSWCCTFCADVLCWQQPLEAWLWLQGKHWVWGEKKATILALFSEHNPHNPVYPLDLRCQWFLFSIHKGSLFINGSLIMWIMIESFR